MEAEEAQARATADLPRDAATTSREVLAPLLPEEPEPEPEEACQPPRKKAKKHRKRKRGAARTRGDGKKSGHPRRLPEEFCYFVSGNGDEDFEF